jgi:1,2-diacylglycerol 3-alpha-glucosyltransferase
MIGLLPNPDILVTNTNTQAVNPLPEYPPPPSPKQQFRSLPKINGNRKLKICMLAACPFPSNHGTPGSIREMSEAISELGHDVHIVTYHFGESIPVQGPTLHRISALLSESKVVVGPTTRRPLYDLQLLFKTLQVIRTHRPDVVHAHGYEAAIAAGICRVLTGVPVLYSGHNTMGDELASYRFIRPDWLARGLARFLDAIVPRLSHRILPHSANVSDFFTGMGLKKRTEPVVNFGIDVDKMSLGNGQAVRSRWGLGDAPVVLYTGVFDQFQRIDLLLEAMKEVVWYEPRAKLLMVVTVPHAGHQERIRQQAAQLGLSDNLVMTDPQRLEAIADYIAAGDVAVVPRPAARGFPIKLLNYMAGQKACVLFASSSTTGLVDRENVLLAAPDTGVALAEGILEVLRDSQLRLRIGLNGHRHVRAHHDRLVVASRVCEAYERTIAQARA